MKNILRFLLIALIALTSNYSFAQEETEKKVEKPVRETFQASTLIESQTVEVSNKKQLELIIHHRMGSVGNGVTDLFGIYAASNIRLGLQYGITDNLSVGIGTEKNNKYQDINAKYAILRQTRSGSMPISLAAHANIVIDTKDDEFFGADYAFTDRFSYFAQIIIARKFTDRLSFQLAPSYAHFNSVDKKFKNDMAGAMIGGRFKVTETMSAIVEYHQPISINAPFDDQVDIEAGLGFGLEISTPTHAFQIFATNYQGIMPQNNYVMNTRKLDGDGILIGFNVNVKFN